MAVTLEARAKATPRGAALETTQGPGPTEDLCVPLASDKEASPAAAAAATRAKACSRGAGSPLRPGSHLRRRRHAPTPQSCLQPPMLPAGGVPLSRVATSGRHHLSLAHSPCPREIANLISSFHNGKWG